MAEIGKPKIIRPHNSEASAIVNVLGTEQVGIFAGSRNPGNLLAVALELKLCGIHKLLQCLYTLQCEVHKTILQN